MSKYTVPISVIMASYNNETSIAKAIKSILKQTYVFFEFIIINDGSCDGTDREIRKFVDPRIKYISNTKKKGNAVVRNIAMKMAKGKYICLMEPNGIASSNRLELQYNFLESHIKVGGTVGACHFVNKIDNTDKLEENKLADSMMKTWLLKYCPIDLCTIMIRSHLIRKHELFFKNNNDLLSDYDFFVKALNFFQVLDLKEVLMENRLPFKNKAGNLTTNTNAVRIEQLKKFNIKITKKEIDVHLKLMNEQYISDDDLKLCEAWCNKLLEANKKNKLFKNNNLYIFLEYSLKIALKNNSLGVWSIEKDLFNFINANILKGSSILEFGSGIGTEALLTKYKVTSIEHDDKYCLKRGRNHKIIYAPIENSWYNKEKVAKALENEYNLIIVDGPIGDLRGGIIQNIDLFRDVKAPIIFDDADRSVDRDVIEKFCEELNYNYKVFKGQKKEFAICTKKKFSKKKIFANDDIANNESIDNKEKQKSNSVILLLTNKQNKDIYNKYKLFENISVDYKVFILLHCEQKGEIKKSLKEAKIFPFRSDILKSLGYSAIGEKLLPGSNHFPLLSFYKENPEFDFYWCIEDDVFYNGKWSDFFDYFKKNIFSDFISSRITNFKEGPNWYWWNTFCHPNKHVLNEDKIRSFNPIYRISNKALSFLDKHMKAGWEGHHEVLVPTLLSLGKFRIQDFGGIGSYVPDDCKNRFYSQKAINDPNQFNIDSFRFRPAIKKEEVNERLLYHPVKDFRDIV